MGHILEIRGAEVKLIPLSPYFIGIPAVVTHELKTLIGNMLDDGGDEVTGGEELKVAMNLGV